MFGGLRTRSAGRYTRRLRAANAIREKEILKVEMTGQQLVPLPQQETWEALNDPAVLKECVPGCESLEQVSDTQYQLTMTARIGPVSAKFKGLMTLQDVEAPRAYTMVFEGQGGVAGFAKGQASVTLASEAEGTRLSYAVKATVGGKIAQLGARLIDGVARKLADDFFKCFNARYSKPEA
jgi:carbon monoxide dehydrogenase subunit G